VRRTHAESARLDDKTDRRALLLVDLDLDERRDADHVDPVLLEIRRAIAALRPVDRRGADRLDGQVAALAPMPAIAPATAVEREWPKP
jgi:hypothetical protein